MLWTVSPGDVSLAAKDAGRIASVPGGFNSVGISGFLSSSRVSSDSPSGSVSMSKVDAEDRLWMTADQRTMMLRYPAGPCLSGANAGVPHMFFC